MTEDFSKFHTALLELVKSFERQNIFFKIHSDPDSNIIKIKGEQSDSLSSAKSGIDEVLELAYATAEHHPYWNLLYNGSQILKIILDNWDGQLTGEELKEINWHTEEIKNSIQHISQNQHD